MAEVEMSDRSTIRRQPSRRLKKPGKCKMFCAGFEMTRVILLTILGFVFVLGGTACMISGPSCDCQRAVDWYSQNTSASYVTCNGRPFIFPRERWVCTECSWVFATCTHRYFEPVPAAPSTAPVAAPQAPPVASPVPVSAPVAPPVAAPVAAPVQPPVSAPVTAPVAAPTSTPVAAPIENSFVDPPVIDLPPISAPPFSRAPLSGNAPSEYREATTSVSCGRGCVITVGPNTDQTFCLVDIFTNFTGAQSWSVISNLQKLGLGIVALGVLIMGGALLYAYFLGKKLLS